MKISFESLSFKKFQELLDFFETQNVVTEGFEQSKVVKVGFIKIKPSRINIASNVLRDEQTFSVVIEILKEKTDVMFLYNEIGKILLEKE